jgi:3-oxoacid CoA-transferase subunit A
MNKQVKSAIEALTKAGLSDGQTLMIGGFGLCGIPENLIKAIKEIGAKELTIISNNAGIDDFGIGILLQTRQVKKMISSYVGENATFEKQYLDGSLEVDLTPQGTLAEKIRAGGAGIPAFYTPTGAGTVIADGKEKKVFNGREYILEESFFADIALVKAWKGDRFGNLVYNKTARNFNPMMATAATVTIAEVDQFVSHDELDPNFIHTAGIFVQMVLEAQCEKRIEQRTVRGK